MGVGGDRYLVTPPTHRGDRPNIRGRITRGAGGTSDKAMSVSWGQCQGCFPGLPSISQPTYCIVPAAVFCVICYSCLLWVFCLSTFRGRFGPNVHTGQDSFSIAISCR